MNICILSNPSTHKKCYSVRKVVFFTGQTSFSCYHLLKRNNHITTTKSSFLTQMETTNTKICLIEDFLLHSTVMSSKSWLWKTLQKSHSCHRSIDKRYKINPERQFIEYISWNTRRSTWFNRIFIFLLCEVARGDDDCCAKATKTKIFSTLLWGVSKKCYFPDPTCCEKQQSVFSSLFEHKRKWKVWSASLEHATFSRFIPLFFTHSEQPRFERITLGLMANGIREEKRESA